MQSPMARIRLATNADIKLNGQVKMAALSYDSAASERLTPASDAASQQRQSLRQQINDHEGSHGIARDESGNAK